MEFLKWSPSWMFLLLWVHALEGDGFLIQNVRLAKCIHATSHEVEKISLADCKPESPQYQWAWDAATRAIVNQKTGRCLTVSAPQEFAPAQLEACGDQVGQTWVCSKKGHLTLQGLGLHLSTKPEGHKAFLSLEKNKFSRWKTETEEIVCAVDAAVAPGPSGPLEESIGTLEWARQSKTVASTEIHTLSVASATTFPANVLENEPNLTSTLPENGDVRLKVDQGTSWKTVMLVLCPLAFILGVIILMLNIHYNRKKKMLSALKRRQVRQEQQLPLPGTASHSAKTPIIPASPSPSLKHGEILIEWKDGTITPLFDSTNDQMC
ncbi:uncharacterized protein LOC134400387 isoform X2 [Elgaria multicarinata webbii]|uniref:uncharacterized protein LOC134400387 isoform X2 n=1 Tax=Elgaria multicarinata webbii TaxID=159646 RepID=UPI002FCCE6F7